MSNANLAFNPSAVFTSTCNTFTIPKNKEIGNNPLYTSSGVRKAKAAEPLRKLEEIHNMYNTLLTLSKRKIACKRNATLFFFGVHTGLRFQSIASIKVRDVFNLDFTVKQFFDVYEQKTGKRNTRPIPVELQNILLDYIEVFKTKTSKNQKPHPLQMNDFLFPSQSDFSKPTELDNYIAVLKKAGKQLNLTYNIGTHSMRKTFAYWIIKNNANDIDTMNCLMKLFNHSSLQTTLMYAGVTQEKTNEMCNNLAALLSGNTSEVTKTPEAIRDSKIDKILALLSEDDEDNED